MGILLPENLTYSYTFVNYSTIPFFIHSISRKMKLEWMNIIIEYSLV